MTYLRSGFVLVRRNHRAPRGHRESLLQFMKFRYQEISQLIMIIQNVIVQSCFLFHLFLLIRSSLGVFKLQKNTIIKLKLKEQNICKYLLSNKT